MITPELLKNKRVILRADLDVPLEKGKVASDLRLKTLLPTLNFCLAHASKTLIIGHLGRPEGVDLTLSLAPVREWLKKAVNQEICFISSGFTPGEWWTGESSLSLMENLRFNLGEESSDPAFVRDLVQGADLYIYDAFATYRPCASLQIIPEVLPTYTGLQFDKEIEALDGVLKNPLRPSLLIASGAKPDKLPIIDQIRSKFDMVILGGKFSLPEDLTPDGLDMNDEAISRMVAKIHESRTIVLNGPLGYIEDGQHTKATRAVLKALSSSSAYTVLGGGDTLSAITNLGFSFDEFGFVSTGGGAMLDYLARGKHLLQEILAKVVR